MASRFFAAVLIVLGTLFLILSIACIVAAWVYNEPLTLEATSRLTEIDTQLSQAQTSLETSQMELERALRIVNAAEEALGKLAGQSTSAENIFANIQSTLDDRLLPELKTTRERILTARTALENLSNTLTTVSSFLPVDLNLPSTILADLITSANSLDAEIVSVEGLAHQASTFVSDTSFLLGGDLTQTKKSLEEFLAVAQEYEGRIGDWRKQVGEIIEKTPKWIDQASIIATVFLLWFGISQFGLILHGLNIRRGSDLFYGLRRRPVSVVEQIREEEVKPPAP